MYGKQQCCSQHDGSNLHRLVGTPTCHTGTQAHILSAPWWHCLAMQSPNAAVRVERRSADKPATSTPCHAPAVTASSCPRLTRPSLHRNSLTCGDAGRGRAQHRTTCCWVVGEDQGCGCCRRSGEMMCAVAASNCRKPAQSEFKVCLQSQAAGSGGCSKRK